ncbi:carbohydrate ABC transporter permease [Cohnella hashimotonis]|uniref:Carbohydrate ABC transporter permease n=1 Tax=Cohnella hashimotonis TaxID=2826895 RepID=A0ABT6TLB0_9BACL|nr:carbohydrate ABC transporter permease [Cohnella hashimotonis]MDI4647356.1 carbohydrate ABC transporter permease [Cohnella hashimotonis]
MQLLKRWRLTPSRAILEILMIAVALCYLIPIWMVFSNSLKDSTGAGLMGLSLPSKPVWDNYAIVFRESDILRGLYNGLLLGLITVVSNVVVASMCSFYLARIKRKISTFFYNYFIAGLIVPGSIIPIYLEMRILHLNNTYIGLVMLFVTATLPFGIFLFTGFIKTIPREIDEAAIIDGSNPYQLYFRIVFPLLKPVTITVSIFVFIAVWNNVAYYLYFSKSTQYPLPLSIYSFFGKYSQSWNLVFADILVGIIPCLILFMFAQKYMVSGITAGAVKG